MVVGIDGSDGSRRALAFAANEAVSRGASLVVLHAWSTHHRRGLTTAEAEAADRAAVEALLSDAVANVLQRHPELTVTERAEHTSAPERALIDASKEAALVVVGSRGRGRSESGGPPGGC